MSDKVKKYILLVDINDNLLDLQLKQFKHSPYTIDSFMDIESIILNGECVEVPRGTPNKLSATIIHLQPIESCKITLYNGKSFSY